VKVPCFRPNRVATNQRGTQPVDWERQPTAFWWYRISGTTANVPATEFTISAVEDRRCHAWGPDGSNQSAMLASCTAVMQYVVGESRVCFASGAFTATGLFSSGRTCNRRLYHNAFISNRAPSTDWNPQYMCVFDPCASMDDIGDDCRPLSVTQQGGCILAKNAHTRHEVDFDVDAICGGRSRKLVVRLQELGHVTVDATPHVFKRAGVYQPSMHEEVRKCYY
jgi:hypothetical protein